MGKKDNAIRFGVGSADGLHSMVWRMWVVGNEVYVAPRVLADSAKVSLHSSGRWRSGFSETHIRRSGMYMAPEADRALLKWHRPPEVAPGWTRAVVILAATVDLSLDAEPHGYENVVWVPAPGNDLDTRLTVLLATPEVPGDEGPPKPWSIAHRVGELQLADGGRAHVAAEQVKLTESELSELDAARSINAQKLWDDEDEVPRYPFAVTTGLDEDDEIALLLSVATERVD